MDIRKIAWGALPIMFFLPYLGIIFPAYAFMLLLIFVRINKDLEIGMYDFFYLILLCVFLAVKINHVGLPIAETMFRYYFGCVITYWFIKIYRIDLDVQKILMILCICIMCEAVIINTLVDPFQVLLNYPRSVFEFNTAGHYTKFMGFYQRPYSIGSNASTSGTILCGLLIYRHVLVKRNEIIPDKKIDILGGITIVLLASGVGLSLYFFYLLYKHKLFTFRRLLIFIVLMYLLVHFYGVIFSMVSSDNILQKVSGLYMGWLLDFKIGQISDVIAVLKEGQNSLLIGRNFFNKSEIIIQSDFAWNDLFHCFGVIGLGLFILFFLNKINQVNVFIVFLFLIGAFHYGGVFSLPGQIIIGHVLFFLSKSELSDKSRIVEPGDLE